MTRDNLPPFCGSRHPTTGEAIMISSGERGYWPAPPGFDPDAYNRDLGVTNAQRMAMEIGSLFGWHVPGANPDVHARLNCNKAEDDE